MSFEPMEPAVFRSTVPFLSMRVSRRALEWWAADLERRGIRLRLAGVTPDVREILEGAGTHLPYTMWDPEHGKSAWNAVHTS